ncbi:MAG: hypothetical protein KUG71_08250 [Porticoccaceae bacterium]|nr:hypothetical protein [Porticoccaceae bacterium]
MSRQNETAIIEQDVSAWRKLKAGLKAIALAVDYDPQAARFAALSSAMIDLEKELAQLHKRVDELEQSD